MKISIRDFVKVAEIVRPDMSKSDLLRFKNEGYTKVVFVANIMADPQCEVHNGEVYEIDELLKMDNPLYRVSHPNCNCKFEPLPSGEENAIQQY